MVNLFAADFGGTKGELASFQLVDSDYTPLSHRSPVFLLLGWLVELLYRGYLGISDSIVILKVSTAKDRYPGLCRIFLFI